MKLNNTLLRIQELLELKKWTIYKLSKESDIPYSSLNSLFLKNNQPTISTLEKICNGFNISLSDFFSNKKLPYYETFSLSKDDILLIEKYNNLNKYNKKLLADYIDFLYSKQSP